MEVYSRGRKVRIHTHVGTHVCKSEINIYLGKFFAASGATIYPQNSYLHGLVYHSVYKVAGVDTSSTSHQGHSILQDGGGGLFVVLHLGRHDKLLGQTKKLNKICVNRL